MARLGPCEKCRYWHGPAGQRAPGPGSWGECRRHAPILSDFNRTRWPDVYGYDWCGDFMPWSLTKAITNLDDDAQPATPPAHPRPGAPQ